MRWGIRTVNACHAAEERIEHGYHALRVHHVVLSAAESGRIRVNIFGQGQAWSVIRVAAMDDMMQSTE